MDRLKKVIKQYKNRLHKKINTFYKIFGGLLIYIGESIIGARSKYRLVSYIIENVLQSKDITVHVVHAYESPLFVRFQLKVSVPKPYDIDGDYFKHELSVQLGCQLSDINTDIENDIYYVEITNTALNNLEKGCTPYIPQAYKEDDYDGLIEDAKKIVLNYGEVSASLLQRKLKIGYARSAQIMDELEEMGIVETAKGSKPRKVIN